MLGDIRHRLERTLREERSCPVRVEYGPVSPARVGELRDAVVIEYDRGAGGAIGAPKTRGGNPARRFSRDVGVKVTIYASATVAGARRQDHEDRAFSIGNQVLVALDNVLRGGKVDGSGVQVPNTQHAWTPGEITFAEGSGEATYAECVLPFVIHTGVHDVVFGGDKAPEFTLTADNFASRTNVHGSHGEGAGETSCGG